MLQGPRGFSSTRSMMCQSVTALCCATCAGRQQEAQSRTVVTSARLDFSSDFKTVEKKEKRSVEWGALFQHSAERGPHGQSPARAVRGFVLALGQLG